MKLQMQLPMAEFHVMTDKAAAGMVGQWITVLISGEAVLGQVEMARPEADGKVLTLVLNAEEFAGLRPPASWEPAGGEFDG